MHDDPPPTITFRRAHSGEAEAVREIVTRSMAHWDRSPAYLAQARELMSLSAEDLERDESWLVLAGAAVAGFYRISRVGAAVAEIEEFHLEPPMIGRGVGRRMFEHACEQARQMGARELIWSTDGHALGFYLRMGGQVTGTEPSGIAGDEPLTAMRLQLDAPS